eukprot:2511447-Pyramimonas_sp.AAC.1
MVPPRTTPPRGQEEVATREQPQLLGVPAITSPHPRTQEPAQQRTRAPRSQETTRQKPKPTGRPAQWDQGVIPEGG